MAYIGIIIAQVGSAVWAQVTVNIYIALTGIVQAMWAQAMAYVHIAFTDIVVGPAHIMTFINIAFTHPNIPRSS